MVSIARWIPKFSLSALVQVGIGLALVACVLVDAADWIEVRALTQLELWAYDARVRLFLPRTRDPRIVIVDIDERSLSAEGHWPWSRDKLALMLHQLFARYRVRVVGFDVAFSETGANSGLPVLEAAAAGELRDNAPFQAFLQRVRPSLDYDRRFAEEIQKDPVVLGFLVSAQGERSGVLPRPAFADDCSRQRGVPLFQRPRLQRQHRAAAGGRDRRGTSVSGARPGRCHAQRAHVHAGRRRLLRGDVAGRPSRLPRQRADQGRDDHRRRRRTEAGVDALRARRRRCAHSARREDGGARSVPQRGQLSLRLGYRRDPWHARRRRAEGPDRHRRHLGPGTRRRPRHTDAGRPPGCGDPREPHFRRARQRHEIPAGGDARHCSAHHPARRRSARGAPPEAVRPGGDARHDSRACHSCWA